MTTGTYSTFDAHPDPYNIDYYSKYFYKSWSGEDRPSYKREFYYRAIYRAKTGSVLLLRKPVRRKPPSSVKDAPHPWSMQFNQRNTNPGVYSSSNGSSGRANVSNWSYNFGYPAFSANDDIRLISKLREQVVGSSFDLGVFLGTGHQSLRLIGDTAIRLVRGITLVKRGNLIGAAAALLGPAHKQVLRGRKRARLLALQDAYSEFNAEISRVKEQKLLPTHSKWIRKRGAYLARLRTRVRALPEDILVRLPPRGERTIKEVQAAAWLELQYGWLPLVQDLKGAAESLAESTLPKRKRYFAQVRASVPSGFVTLEHFAPITAYPRFTKFEASKRVVAYIQESNVPTMVDLLDIKTVAWELLPWSFVADWAIPIGEYLSARGFASTVTGTYVITQRQYLDARDFSGTHWQAVITDYRFQSSSFKAAQYIRSVSSSLDVPTPEVKGFGQIPSWRRAANAVALLVQHHR